MFTIVLEVSTFEKSFEKGVFWEMKISNFQVNGILALYADTPSFYLIS